MKPFREYYTGLSNLNHTTTKNTSYRYSPTEDSNTRGNPSANTESEERIKRRKKIKKFINYKGKAGMFTKANTPIGVKGNIPTI